MGGNMELWRVKHYLFGWHYIEYRDSATSFVARVVRVPSGEVRMRCGFIRSHYNAMLTHDGGFNRGAGKWTALTWSDAYEIN